MQLESKPWRDLKPDAQGFDEIRILTVPRWKESELSGDEWRISAKVQFWRKGRLVHEVGYGRNVESAVIALGYLWQQAHDDGKAFFAGEDNLCDQEGCSAEATVTYRKKFAYDTSGNKHDLHRETHRKFCDRHKRRGDCGLDDADDNYELVEA